MAYQAVRLSGLQLGSCHCKGRAAARKRFLAKVDLRCAAGRKGVSANVDRLFTCSRSSNRRLLDTHTAARAQTVARATAKAELQEEVTAVNTLEATDAARRSNASKAAGAVRVTKRLAQHPPPTLHEVLEGSEIGMPTMVQGPRLERWYTKLEGGIIMRQARDKHGRVKDMVIFDAQYLDVFEHLIWDECHLRIYMPGLSRQLHQALARHGRRVPEELLGRQRVHLPEFLAVVLAGRQVSEGQRVIPINFQKHDMRIINLAVAHGQGLKFPMPCTLFWPSGVEVPWPDSACGSSQIPGASMRYKPRGVVVHYLSTSSTWKIIANGKATNVRSLDGMVPALQKKVLPRLQSAHEAGMGPFAELSPVDEVARQALSGDWCSAHMFYSRLLDEWFAATGEQVGAATGEQVGAAGREQKEEAVAVAAGKQEEAGGRGQKDAATGQRKGPGKPRAKRAAKQRKGSDLEASPVQQQDAAH